MKFRGKNILVVGFGASGRAAARFLLQEGAAVAVTDAGLPPVSMPSWSSGRLECYWRGHPPAIFRGRDLIVVSPGVPLDLPGIRTACRLWVPGVGGVGVAAGVLEAPPPP